ncbi:MAG TPA: hypothetical protein VFG54_14795 [Prolixibacteraceae bacterium]|nr:hypothetical protein [Prolixibacteraceae bacterium]
MKTLLTLLFLCCFLGLKAQTNFLPGYIITNENDTLNGLIDYRSEARNAKKCEFKESEMAPVREFLPHSIKSYRFIDRKYYISQNIMVDGNEIPVFLEFLINGISDLYFYTDGKKSHYYITKEDGKFFELTNDEVQFERDGKQYVTRSKKYIGQLKNVFADCQQLYPMINSSKMGHKSLIDLTRKYHDYVCDGEKCIIYEKKLPAVRFSFAPFAATNASFLKFIGNDLYGALDFGRSAYPTYGLALNTSLPRFSEKLSFQLSCEYGKAYFHGTGNPPHTNAFDEVQIHTTVLKNKVGFQYTWPKGKFRPTFLLGLNYIKLMETDAERTEDLMGTQSVFMEKYSDVPLDDMLVGYNIDLGISYYTKASLIPFVKLGFENSFGSNIVRSQSANNQIKNIQLHAGIYF